jgi:sRNA-binding carbon storage regulator CsrA
MLVLSRKAGQSLRLANGVRITLVKFDGQAVRRQEIAFEVPQFLPGEPGDP